MLVLIAIYEAETFAVAVLYFHSNYSIQLKPFVLYVKMRS